jgi:hypothetical protein
MNKAIPGLLALLALGACAADTHDRSATPTAAEPQISPDAVGASGRRRPRPVITSIVRVKSHAELYGYVVSGTGQHLCGAQYCVGAQAAGACGPSVHLDCSCLGELYAEVHTGPATGDCTVTIRVRDQEGLEGEGSVTFPVGD